MKALIALLTLLLGLAIAGPLRAEGVGSVVVIELAGAIEPASQRYLQHGLAGAARSHADLVVVELDTPGGLLASLREMTTAVTRSTVPVAVYVTPAGAHAASAGFFLLLAGDVAAMAPGTNAGAAHPVTVGPAGASAEIEKATNDAAALARSLAAQRGRPVEAAERTVRQSVSYTEREALAKGLIDLVAPDRAALLAALDGRALHRFDGSTATLHLGPAPATVEVRPGLTDRLLMAIAHPDIAYILLLLGMVGLMVELTHPGAVLPGVLGALSLLLALFAFSVLPVNAVGALLLLAAIGLFVADVIVTSHGLLTVAGIIAFVFGSVMLIEAPVPAWRIGLGLVLPAAVVVAAVMFALVTRVVRSRRRPSVVGAEALAGELGEVVVPFERAGAEGHQGKVFVHGEYWDAASPESLPKGARVRIVGLHGDHLDVRTAEEAPAG